MMREPAGLAATAYSLSSRWPQFEQDEVEAATAVLAAGKVNALVHGEQTRAFEKEFASFLGTVHAVAVSNGTVALELALRALGIGPGDEVIVPARSFFATVSCVVAVGATPVFADIDRKTQNILPESAARMVSRATRAIICVHLGGLPCDVSGLQQLCGKEGLFLIEDCAQAHGAAIDGRMVGSFGDIAAFSFCTDKIISTGGEGGMVVTSSGKLWKRAFSYKDHGKDPDKIRQHAPGSRFRYIHDEFGSNFRMTEFQAAIGRRQLAKLPHWLGRRRRNAQALSEALRDHPLCIVPSSAPGVMHAWYKYNLVIRVEDLRERSSVEEIVDILRAQGITCGTGSCPDMSQEAAFRTMPKREGDLPNAAWLGRRNLMLAVDHLFEPEQMRAIGDIAARTIA